MNAPRPITVRILSLSDAAAEECRLACLPDKTPAEKARLALLQTANAINAAGQDESRPRAHGRTNFKE